jgi:vacuolar-type H+-ATPase subunit E/Vma4
MGESELKIALRRDGDERIRDIWQVAEESVTKRRRELEVEMEQVRSEADRQLQLEVSRLRNGLLAEAQTRAMENRLQAESAFEERLKQLTSRLLTELAYRNREVMWQELCTELPPAEWGKVRVSPLDQGRAARDFPTAEIELDDALDGGMIATSVGGAMRIDNSLGTRLSRAWPDLLPQLMSEVRRMVDEDETA